MEAAIFPTLNLDDSTRERFCSRGQEDLLQDLAGTEKLGLSLCDLAELLVRFPVTLLASRAAVESWGAKAEIFGGFLTDTACAVSSSWFGADGARVRWRIGGSHG